VKIKRSKLVIGIAAVVIIAVIAVMTFTRDREVIVARSNGINVSEDYVKILMMESAIAFKEAHYPNVSDEDYKNMTDEEKAVYWGIIDNFWETPVNGKMPLDILKEETLIRIKVHAYFKIACREKNFSMSELQIQGINADLEARFKEVDILKLVGVEKKKYFEFMQDNETFGKYSEIEATKFAVDETEIKEYFEGNRKEYSKIIVKTIFLKDKEGEDEKEKEALAYLIKDKMINGENVDELIEEYSEEKGNNNGEFIVIKSSTIGEIFGENYLTRVIESDENSIEVVKTAKGYCINKTMSVGMTDMAEVNIAQEVRKIKLANEIKSIVDNNVAYEVEMLKQDIFDNLGLPAICFD